ncbi:MAG TPA: metallophosphoesterase family protein [Actinomycetota bacterium]|nr:metallophosphoesterase family protein [Actinomycetota bacterium]
MRIAVLSDIHGNLLALDAVMTDLEAQDVDEVWCGGDVAWGGPWAAECIRRVRDAGWTTVRGNTDVWITGDPQTAEDEDQRQFLKQMAEAHQLSDEDARWLLNLPLGHSGRGSILLVHGTPESPFVGPLPDAPTRDFRPYEGGASIVVYGHVHQAFVRRLTDGTIVANAGSVGFPLDAPSAAYLIIDQEGPEWTLRHRRVTFDRRAVIAQARALGGPIGDWTIEKLSATS